MKNIIDWLKTNKITEVECIVPDMAGVSRGKIMPAAKFASEGGMRLPESIFAQTVTGGYADRPYKLGITNEADIDMDMRPDADTLRLVPWAKEPTAQVIHDGFYLDGSAVEIAPRFVLKSIIELYRKSGWRPVVAPELEFSLVKPSLDPDYPLEPPVGRSGRPETGSQAFSIDAANEFDPLSTSAYDLPVELPHDLFEALRMLNGNSALQEILGEKFVAVYTAIKETEFETFMRVISPWEREYLLLNV